MLYFSLLTIVVIGIVIFVIERSQKHHGFKDVQITRSSAETHSTYHVRSSLLGRSEAKLYEELMRQIPRKYKIFMKIRIADVIETTRGSRYVGNRNAIWSRHFDFVIASQDFLPLVAIELNGSSHEHKDRAYSDERKRGVCEEANLPLEVIAVGNDFSAEVTRILHTYKLS
jgi:hypothetical protein